MKVFRGWLAVTVGLSFSLAGQNPEEALNQAFVELREDIQRDTQALQDLREEIAKERIPLAHRLENLRKTLAEQRKTAEQLRRLRNQGENIQAEQESRARALQEESTYLRSLFTEYSRAMDTRMSAARNPELLLTLNPIRTNLENPDTPLSSAIRDLLEASITWNTERIGGKRFGGEALDEAGTLHQGTFATAGPLGFFASETPEGPAGLVRTQFGSDLPALYSELPSTTLTSIRRLATTGNAEVPLDVSNGDAIRVAEATPGILEQASQGGFTMIPLAAVAMAAVFLAGWKTLELSRIHVGSDPNVEAVMTSLRTGDVETARSKSQHIQRPLRRLIDDLIEYRDAPREHLEEIMHEHVLASLPFLERNLGALAVLGGVAPLLGLLGTVTGMINTFRLVTLFGSGDAKLLAGGISEALVTTFTGLAIAIPTLLIHAALARRARGIIGALETMAATLVNDLKLRSSS